jgi:hypothetical protein
MHRDMESHSLASFCCKHYASQWEIELAEVRQPQGASCFHLLPNLTENMWIEPFGPLDRFAYLADFVPV